MPADNLSILQAAVRGVDLRRHRESTICCGQEPLETALLIVLSAAAYSPELQLPDRACARQPRVGLAAQQHLWSVRYLCSFAGDFAFAPGDVRQLELAEESVAPMTSTFACRKPPSCM